MTHQFFITDTYNRLKDTILNFDKTDVPNIYVISFYISNDGDDPRRPMLTVGYNTVQRWTSCIPSNGQEANWPIASDSDEARWNYAFWLQNEELVIGDHNYDPVIDWVKDSPYYYTDEQEEEDFEKTYELGEQIQNKFIDIVISHAKRLHSEGVIRATFKKDIPIIIHELEYYDKPLDWTRQGNPPHLIKEFDNWVTTF